MGPRPTFEYEVEAVRTTFYKRVENEIVDGGINGKYKWRYKWRYKWNYEIKTKTSG